MNFGKFFPVASPLLLVAGSLQSAPVYAEESGPQALPEQGVPASNQDDIIVTARNRTELLTRVPESVTSLSAAAIQSAGIENLADLNVSVSGFSQIRAQDPATNFIIVRGITQVRFGEPSVAFVVDGVQASSPDQASQELFDVERIEVLKGPQGPTYGRNAIGGAVVISTRMPSATFEADGSLEYADGPLFKAQASLSGPLGTPDALFRISAGYRNDDGQIRNVTTGGYANRAEETVIRGRLLLTPTPDFRIDLRAGHADLKGASGSYYPIFPGQTANAVNSVIANRIGIGARVLTETSAKLDYDFGGATLTSISSYAKVTASTIAQDIDFLPFPIAPTFPGVMLDQTREVESWSEELRLASPTSGAFTWMIGAYYLNTRRDVTTNVFLDLGTQRGPQLSLLPERNRNKAYAVFGTITYDPTEKLHLELGLRQDWDDREQRNPATGSRVTDNFKSLQPKVSISYYPSPDNTIYASLGRGFRSGGFNVENPLFPRRYPAETADTAEVGFKSRFADRRLSINGALFYTRGRNAQTFRFDGATGTQGILTINRTHFYGGEMDLRWRISPNLELSGAATLLHSNIDDYDGTALYRGNPIPLVNHRSVNAGVQYNRALTRDLTLQLRADYAGFGDLSWHVDNVVTERRGWVNTANVRATIKGASGWSIAVYADNVFNVRYPIEFDAGRFTGTPTDIAVPNAPRRVGVVGRIAL